VNDAKVRGSSALGPAAAHDAFVERDHVEAP
jgi:hypothetical protein